MVLKAKCELNRKKVILHVRTVFISNFKLLQEISFFSGKFIKNGYFDKGWECKDNCTIEITEHGNFVVLTFDVDNQMVIRENQ